VNALGVLVYVMWTSLAVAASAWLLERALTSLRLPLRWVWLGALWLSVSLPTGALLRAWAGAATAAPSGGPESTPPASAGSAGAPDVGGLLEPGGTALQRLFGWWSEPVEMIASGAGLLPAFAVPPSTLVVLCLASSVMAALILGLSLLRLRRRVRGWPAATLLGHSVTVAPETGPATIGILAPRIVLPRWALSLPEPDLALILSHEAEHVRSRDTLLLSAGLLAVVACPWNPLLWWQMRRIRAAVEVDCDRRVLRDGLSPTRYARLLLTLGTRGHRRSLLVPTIAGSTSLLERRLNLMKRRHGRLSIPTAVVTSTLAMLLLLVACEGEPPIALDGRGPADGAASGAAERAGAVAADVVAIWVDRDGSVQVNGSPQPVDRIAEMTTPLAREGVIASIEAHRNAPYGVVAAVQEELRRANQLRVVFTSVAPEGERPTPRPSATLVEEGLPVVLPDTSGRLVHPSGRNVLEVQVLPTGMLDLSRAESSAVDRVERDRIESIVRDGLALNPNLIVLVRTRPDAEYRYMYEVLAALQRANATRFSLQLAE
jgi:biopolymer transport protein ExbD